jgi:hypothetical protein
MYISSRFIQPKVHIQYSSIPSAALLTPLTWPSWWHFGEEDECSYLLKFSITKTFVCVSRHFQFPQLFWKYSRIYVKANLVCHLTKTLRSKEIGPFLTPPHFLTGTEDELSNTFAKGPRLPSTELVNILSMKKRSFSLTSFVNFMAWIITLPITVAAQSKPWIFFYSLER